VINAKYRKNKRYV